MGAFRLTAAGFHQIPAAVYHTDPAPEPSLSHSIAKLLLRRSPAHARIAHPRLGAVTIEREPSDAMEAGTVLHEMILGRVGGYVEVLADDWRTTAAKRKRAEVREEGRVPILSRHLGKLRACADAVTAQIAEHPGCEGFMDEEARSELTLLWQIGPIWCRGLADRLHPFRRVMWDLKATGMSAEPVEFGAKIIKDYATQDAWYRLGAGIIDPDEQPWDFRFVAFEEEPPYGLSVHSLPALVLEFANHEMMRATRMWAQCMLTGEWPCYGTALHQPSMSDYAMGKAADALIQWTPGSALAA